MGYNTDIPKGENLMTRDEMIEEYITQYQENNPEECEREMRKELRCMDNDELMEEFLAYCR